MLRQLDRQVSDAVVPILLDRFVLYGGTRSLHSIIGDQLALLCMATICARCGSGGMLTALRCDLARGQVRLEERRHNRRTEKWQISCSVPSKTHFSRS